MREEIIAFVRTERQRLAAESGWQDGYDPNDYEAYGRITGGLDTLQQLCWHFELGDVDGV